MSPMDIALERYDLESFDPAPSGLAVAALFAAGGAPETQISARQLQGKRRAGEG